MKESITRRIADIPAGIRSALLPHDIKRILKKLNYKFYTGLAIDYAFVVASCLSLYPAALTPI